MMIFLKPRLVVLAVPKTGTTALEGALGADAAIHIKNPPYLKHMRARQVQRQILPLLQDPDRFEFFARIRNPLDWLGSWFRYRKGDLMAGRADSTRGITFEGFVLEYMKDKDAAAYASVGMQSRAFNGQGDSFTVEHLFRYEAEAAWSGFLSDRLQREVKTNRVNVSADADLSLSDETNALLHVYLKDEIALWEAAQH